jgi:hypothetical protein
VEGAREIAVTVAPGTYTARLCFAELEELRAGNRVFHVALQEKDVLRDFDVVRAAGGPHRSVVRKFRRVRADGVVKVRLVATEGSRPPILCGIELLAEEREAP